MEDQTLPEISEKITTLYLDCSPNGPQKHQIPLDYSVNLKNSSNFTILSLSILSRGTQKEILSVKEIAPLKAFQFEFRSEGFFDLNFCFSQGQKFEKQCIQVVPKSSDPANIRPNFSPKLKPSWLNLF